MASTNKTTNYDLSQFIETDKPGWLTDYNSDMRKLDAGLKSVSDIASGASADLSDLTDRVSTAESAITTNTNDITSLDARTDSLEAQAQASAGAITNLQTEQTTQNLGIEAATKIGYNIARPYDAASTYAVGDYVLFQNTLYKCITAIPVGEEFVPSKWLAIKVMDEISPYTLPIASANVLGGVKVGNGLNVDPVTGLLSVGWTESSNFITNATATGSDGTQQAFNATSQKAYYNDKLFFFNAMLRPVSTDINIEPDKWGTLTFDIEIPNEVIIDSNLSLNQTVSVWNSQSFVNLIGWLYRSDTKARCSITIYNMSSVYTQIQTNGLAVSGFIIRK